MSSEPLVTLGVDACGRRGWLGVALRGGRFLGATVRPTVAELLERFPDADPVGIDIPIGLVEHGFREADDAAREFLRPHLHSVFRTPPRPALEKNTYLEASREAHRLTGKRISKQTWGLAARILEVDALRSEARLFEVHPEVAFKILNDGRPLRGSKKTWNGLRQRLSLLGAVGIELPGDLEGAGRIPPDDVVDAAVCAWSAGRIARGVARTLPEKPSQLDGGRPIAIFA